MPYLAGMSRASHLERLDLHAILKAMIPHHLQRRLDELAPARIAIPSGAEITIDYEGDGDPVLRARLQEMFGLEKTPSVAGGRQPLLLKLLSPAGRPVQITRDLVSFWERGYHEVRKDLKGRYPKHYWPDDPHAAVPTRRVRPR